MSVHGFRDVSLHLLNFEYYLLLEKLSKLGCQIVSISGVRDLEDQAWIREFLRGQPFFFLLLAVPEPLVQLLLGVTSFVDQVTEFGIVPCASVQVVDGDEKLGLLLRLSASVSNAFPIVSILHIISIAVMTLVNNDL